MMFDKVRKEVTIQGHKLVLAEMDALNFTKMLEMKDEGESIFFMISQCIESPTQDIEEVKKWPSSVINELTTECVELLGMSGETKKK